jgi:hypothetical protein
MKIPPPRTLLPWIAALLPFSGGGSHQPQLQEDWRALPTSHLEERLVEIDAQLDTLASFSLRGGIGSIGYRSYWESERQWVEIELSRTYPIHEIILTPCLTRHPNEGFQSDAFPLELNVRAGTGSDRTGTVIAEYTHAEGSGHGIEPLILPVSGTLASWIRIEATELSARRFDRHKVLQLSEILIFSGSENVALHRPVSLLLQRRTRPHGRVEQTLSRRRLHALPDGFGRWPEQQRLFRGHRRSR